MRILDCQMNEVLYESTSTRVFRGLHQPSGQRIIIKQARATRTSIIARLRREYRLAREISGAAVVEPIAFCEEQSANEPPAIIYADFGGVALSSFLREAMDVTGFLELACQLARILQAVHESQIVHQDIKPANIIIHPTTGEARLTDFGIAVQNDGGMIPALRMRGTLAYMAPKQSGRMNRAIDHRADLYSLGITCYEALTGQLPFDTSEDALEMIHRHLAVRPVDPHLLKPGVPDVLSAIIMKLLAKDAEDRYQSAAGLRADLEECRRQWLAHGKIRAIEIGGGDVPDTFSVSAKTFGRDTERAQLLDLFRRVLLSTSDITGLLVLAELYGRLTEIRKAEEVPFEQEWQFIEEYLKLMQLRYHKSLEVRLDRPPELPQIKIPPLTLQPIIENSFKHGFADLSDRMRLSVTLSVDVDRIEVDLRDNGKGYQRPIRDTDTLHSIRERLRHYLPNARIETESLTVGSRTLVVIPLNELGQS